LATFWSSQLVLAMILNAVVQAIQIGAYAARLAGVQSGRIATSISLFNLFVTASRLASLFLTPALGALADAAAHGAGPQAHSVAPAVAQTLEMQIRFIVLAGTFGTAIGALLLPTFIALFLRGIAAFERTGSVIAALSRLADPRVLWSIVSTVRLPSLATLRRFSPNLVPRKLLVFNVLVTAVYAIGVVAAYYASVLNLLARTTATGLSGLINGIATVTFTLVVDPTSALITDQAAKGERSLEEVKAMVFYLALTAIVGTLCSQLLLYPAAVAIAHAAGLFYHPHY
jgi:hypothetical protein